jgi:hypothetical protein
METQTCSKCHLPQPVTEFFIRCRATGKRHSQCKTCYKNVRAPNQHAHYEANKGAYVERAKKRNRAVRAELFRLLMEYLHEHPCPCGEADPVVLEFHHTDPKIKEATVSGLLRLLRPWPLILREIEKCEVLCANCHKRRTAAHQGWRRLTA